MGKTVVWLKRHERFGVLPRWVVEWHWTRKWKGLTINAGLLELRIGRAW